MTHIFDGVFSRCHSLSNISFAPSLKYVGDCAFEFCTSLSSITIPSTIGYIGAQVFLRCKSLQTISLRSPFCDTHHQISISLLHFVLMFASVQNYDDEIGEIMTTNPTSLTERDPVYNVYPFLLAACMPKKVDEDKYCKTEEISSLDESRDMRDIQHLETVFVLLLEAPWVMNTLIPKKTTKPS